MNKIYLGVGVVVFALIAGVFLVINQPATTPTPTVPINTATSSIETVATTTDEPALTDIELDLSKLQGKDRLYTEEEGKYENLSEEERKLLKKIFCTGNELEWLCDESPDSFYVQKLRLVSLHDNTAMIYTQGDGPKYLSIWHVSTQGTEYLTKYSVSQDNVAYGTNYVVIMSSRSDGELRKVLRLYRPSMSDFIQIPDSQIDKEFSYLEHIDYFNRTLPIEFNGESITAYVYHYEYNENGPRSDFGNLPLEYKLISVSPRTFDLSNLR